MKIHVAHVVDWPRSGITSLLRNWFRRDDDVEHSVAFLQGEVAEIDAFGRRCRHAADLGWRRGPWGVRGRWRRLSRTWVPDVVHTHAFKPRLLARLARDDATRPLVTTYHSPYPHFVGLGPRDRLKAAIEAWSVNRGVGRVVCVSDFVREHLRAHSGIRPDLLQVIRNGVVAAVPPAAREAADGLRADLGLAADVPLVVSVGRFSPEKGLDLLVEAFAHSARHRPAARLVLVGDGAERGDLERRVREHGLTDQVVLPGWQEDPLPWVLAADVFACPSRVEGLGMSVIEALVAETPVVAFRVGGVPEIVEDGASGLLVPADSVAEFADALSRALAHPDEMRILAAEGRRRVENDMSLDAMVQGYHAIYQELLAGAGRRRANGE